MTGIKIPDQNGPVSELEKQAAIQLAMSTITRHHSKQQSSQAEAILTRAPSFDPVIS